MGNNPSSTSFITDENGGGNALRKSYSMRKYRAPDDATGELALHATRELELRQLQRVGLKRAQAIVDRYSACLDLDRLALTAFPRFPAAVGPLLQEIYISYNSFCSLPVDPSTLAAESESLLLGEMNHDQLQALVEGVNALDRSQTPPTDTKTQKWGKAGGEEEKRISYVSRVDTSSVLNAMRAVVDVFESVSFSNDSTLEEFVRSLVSVRIFRARCAQLAFSAPDVSSLRFLVELDISHNAFESIDRLCGVVRAESIEQQEHPLPRLQVLRMDGASHFSRQNQFRLPPRIALLSSLTELDISRCALRSLPPLPSSLKTLICIGNDLTICPDLSSNTILRQLDISLNRIMGEIENDHLPRSLKSVSVRGNANAVVSLPFLLLRCPLLEEVDVSFVWHVALPWPEKGGQLRENARGEGKRMDSLKRLYMNGIGRILAPSSCLGDGIPCRDSFLLSSLDLSASLSSLASPAHHTAHARSMSIGTDSIGRENCGGSESLVEKDGGCARGYHTDGIDGLFAERIPSSSSSPARDSFPHLSPSRCVSSDRSCSTSPYMRERTLSGVHVPIFATRDLNRLFNTACSLEVLEIRGCALHHVPEEIILLTNLQELDLACNRLQLSFSNQQSDNPPRIFPSSLLRLDLSHNAIQHPPTFINSESLPILRYLHLLNNPFLEAQPYMKKSLSMAIPSATLWKVFEGEDGLLSPRSSSNREKERTRERERGICSPERTRRGFSVAPLSPGMRKRHGTLSPLHDRFSASSYQGTMPNENEGSGAIDQSFDPNAVPLPDRIIGLVLGAAIGGRIGRLTAGMTAEEARLCVSSSPDIVKIDKKANRCGCAHQRQGDHGEHVDMILLLLSHLQHRMSSKSKAARTDFASRSRIRSDEKGKEKERKRKLDVHGMAARLRHWHRHGIEEIGHLAGGAAPLAPMPPHDQGEKGGGNAEVSESAPMLPPLLNSHLYGARVCSPSITRVLSHPEYVASPLQVAKVTAENHPEGLLDGTALLRAVTVGLSYAGMQGGSDLQRTSVSAYAADRYEEGNFSHSSEKDDDKDRERHRARDLERAELEAQLARDAAKVCALTHSDRRCQAASVAIASLISHLLCKNKAKRPVDNEDVRYSMIERNDEPPGHQAARLACAVALNSVAARAVSPRMPRAKGGEGSSKPYDDAAEMDMDEVGELEWYMFSASEIGDVNLEVDKNETLAEYQRQNRNAIPLSKESTASEENHLLSTDTDSRQTKVEAEPYVLSEDETERKYESISSLYSDDSSAHAEDFAKEEEDDEYSLENDADLQRESELQLRRREEWMEQLADDVRSNKEKKRVRQSRNTRRPLVPPLIVPEQPSDAPAKQKILALKANMQDRMAWRKRSTPLSPIPFDDDTIVPSKEASSGLARATGGNSSDYCLKMMSVCLCAARHSLDSPLERAFLSFLQHLAMRGGSSDLSLTLAGAVLGCRLGAQNLPLEWVQTLEHREYLTTKALWLCSSLDIGLT